MSFSQKQKRSPSCLAAVRIRVVKIKEARCSSEFHWSMNMMAGLEAVLMGFWSQTTRTEVCDEILDVGLHRNLGFWCRLCRILIADRRDRSYGDGRNVIARASAD